MLYSRFSYLVRADLHRVNGSTSLGIFLKHFFTTPGFKIMFYFRLCQYMAGKWYMKPACLISKCVYYRNQWKYGIGLPLTASIGPGFRINHFSCIFIGRDVVIGKNCSICQGVTLGQTLRGKRKGCPILGDNVFLGPGSKILGKVTIGDDVLVTANSVVSTDVPSGSVVVGIPSKVISKNGSGGYITKTDY